MLNVVCRQVWCSNDSSDSKAVHLMFLRLNAQIMRLNTQLNTSETLVKNGNS